MNDYNAVGSFPAVLQACDQLGILVSMEIPLDHEISDTEAFYKNTKVAMQEMIRQHYNHSSIIIWAYMNEMLLGKQLERDREEIEKIVKFARELENLTREEDPDRYTMIPNHGVLDLYHQAGLLDIPMIVGWNVYFGWYNDGFEYLTEFMDEFRRKVPNKPVMITEYGAGSDPRIYAYPYLDSTSAAWNSGRFDFSIDYQNAFHQSYLAQFQQMNFLSGTAVWNLFDFGSYNRQDAVPRINSKGLASHDRQPKDAYYIYQSWLTEHPVTHFLSKNVSYKPLTEPRDRVSVTTNLPEIELFLNDKSVGVKRPVNNLVWWEIAPLQGVNHLLARGTRNNIGVQSSHIINYDLITSPYSQISINLGACIAFIDQNENYWLPGSEIPGLMVDGNPFKRRINDTNCEDLGTLRNILLTSEDPLFQTGIIDAKLLRTEVEPGLYRINLFFAKLERVQENDVFEVIINGASIKTISLLEAFVARTLSTELYLEGDLKLEFKTVSGKSIINAIQLYKID